MGNISKALFVIIVIAVLLSGSVWARGRGEVHETFPAKERVNINTVSGNCIVTRGSSDEIDVRLTYDIRPEHAFEPEMSERGKYLKLEENMYGSCSGESEWVITVPEGTSVRFRTASGDIRIEDLDGEFDINTASGDIEMINCKGELELNTASGDITLENCSGDFRVNTASGDIDGIETGIDYASSFNTASGDIEVQLAKTPTVGLSLSTASGRAELDYNGNPIKGYFELIAKLRGGRIVAPFEADAENWFRRHGDEYVSKTYLRDDDEPEIILETASGRVALRED